MDRVLGWFWYSYDESNIQKEAFVYDFCIYQKYQKKGFGKTTMVAFIELAKEKGIKKISLHVFAHNESAINLYKKIGFELTDISMTKKLVK